MAEQFVGKAITMLGNAAYAEVVSWWGARADLVELRETLGTIKHRVYDAECNQEADGSRAIKKWLRRLRLVVYRIEDLLEEVHYGDHEKQQMEGSLLAKICFFFSWYGPLCLNFKVAHEIKSIKRELDAIMLDMDRLLLKVDSSSGELPMAPLIKKRETSSGASVKEEDVIGRENDAKKIINMLLDPKYDGEQITVIPIVGFGGVGKTTLAQLVFNDARVQNHFHPTAWAYVPEKDDLIVIKRKIFQAFKQENYQNQTLEYIEHGIIKSIANKKYLLVLDDLWTEEGADIIKLLKLLKQGKRGSKVIVTTRSDVVATHFVPIGAAYKLKPLTDDESWKMFKRLAFRMEQESNDPELSTIGRDIVNMCGNVPLAIEVVGGSLHSPTQSHWWHVKENLSKALSAESHNIMATLKISYDYLQPVSKLCFAYCSLFPKGFEFEKDDLVRLWMAQGYVEPGKGDQYFWDLVARNLFQGPEIYDEEVFEIYKMHDLLHDLALTVAGEEIRMLKPQDQNCDRLVHVNLNGSTCPPSLKDADRLRSLLHITYNVNDEKLYSKLKSLRVLSMEHSDEHKKLPNPIGRLIHLRYLKLKSDAIEYLPNFITRLVNLQTLHLQSCRGLKELPRDFAKLVNLRHLLLPRQLTDLPPGFGKLTSLQELNTFIVGKGNGIDSLGSGNLRGEMKIYLRRWRRGAIEEGKRANLKNNYQLASLILILDFEEEESTPIAVDGMNEMLRCLQLPPNLKDLRVWRYKGDEMPVWWLGGLCQLVSIQIAYCKKCKVLPKFNGLPHLKHLDLIFLDELEYVEDEDNIRVGTATQNRCFFRSLEILRLWSCYKLKRWTKASKYDGQLVFPCLLSMHVEECPMLMSMPLAPKLESLYVSKTNWRSNDDEEAASSSSAPLSSSSSTLPVSLKELEIECVNDGLISLSISSSLCNLSEINIRCCSQLRNLRFESPNFIRKLEIERCSRLRHINEGLQHLSGLERLVIKDCEELEMEGKSCSGWQGLSSLTLLRKLYIEGCPKVKSLPESILGLPMLQELYIWKMENLTELPAGEIGNGNLPLLRLLNIRDCPKMKSLPTSILVSLQTLDIRGCPDPAKKNMPNGEGWRLIQHIPNLFIDDGSATYIKEHGEIEVYYNRLLAGSTSSKDYERSDGKDCELSDGSQ